MTDIEGSVEAFYSKIATEVKTLQSNGENIEQIKASLKDKYEESDINVGLAKAGIGVEHKKGFFEKDKTSEQVHISGEKKRISTKTILLIAGGIVVVGLIALLIFF